MSKLVLVLLVLTLSPVWAQVTLSQRTDFSPTGKPYHVAGVIGPSFDFWAYGYDSKDREIDLGGLSWKPVKGLTVEPYLSLQPHGKVGVLGCLYLQRELRHLGKAKIDANLGYYLPLHSSGHALYSDSSRITWDVGNSTQLGAATSFWRSGGGTTPISFGPFVQKGFGKTSVRLMYLPWSVGGKPSRVFRVQVMLQL